MHLRAPAILCASRTHGETAAVIRLLTADHGLLAAYCAGARGRRLRPVVIPGNLLDAERSARSASQLPFARVELVESRGPWLGEPLASAATALPEGHPYPALYQALGGLLDAICHAPSARGWSRALAAYEALLLRELGYGGQVLAGGQAASVTTTGSKEVYQSSTGQASQVDAFGDFSTTKLTGRYRL